MISALELVTYATTHHKDPEPALNVSLILMVFLMIGGIAGFMIAVWRVESQSAAGSNRQVATYSSSTPLRYLDSTGDVWLVMVEIEEVPVQILYGELR